MKPYLLISETVVHLKDARLVLGIAAVSIFLAGALATIYNNPLHKLIDSFNLMPFLIVFSIIAGAGTYALMAGRLEKKDQGMQKAVGIMLRFLSDDERKVVEKLIGSGGRAYQAEVTRMQDMSKLRVHRAVRKLVRKRIIEMEKTGKTNSLKLVKEIQEALN